MILKNSKRLKNLEKQMHQAESYQGWKDAAVEHDEITGRQRWKQVDQTSLYDYAQIRIRVDR